MAIEKEKIEKNKQEIITWLKQIGRMPTSKISALTGIPYDYIIKYLEELEKNKKIIKEKETNATYWKIKK